MWGKAIARDNLTLFYTLFLSFGKANSRTSSSLPYEKRLLNQCALFLIHRLTRFAHDFFIPQVFFFFYWIIPQVISVWWKWNIFGNQKRNSSRINISLILLQWIIPQVLSVSSTQITPYVLLLKWWLSGRLLVQVHTPSPKSETQNLLVFSFDWNCET